MLKELYKYSPKIIQEIMLSIYSYKITKKRYPLNLKEIISKKVDFEKNSKEDQEKANEKLLKEILSYSYKNVELYKKSMKKVGFDFSKDILEEIKKLPFTTKKTYVDNYDKVISKMFDKKNLIVDFTSGSTGTPLKIYKDINFYQQSFIQWEVLRRNFGVKVGDKRATFFGREIVSKEENKSFWRHNFYQKQLLFSIFHLKKINIPAYVKKMNSFKPAFIESYPSGIYIFAKYISELNLKLEFTPKVIFTTAENLEPHMRKLIEKVFNCKVIDQYGATESVVFAAECKYGKMHIVPEFGYTEILKNNGSVSDIGYGELIVTGLLNKAMPFIRYRTGDIVELDYEKCSCGREGKIIKTIDGRKDDIIITPDGREIGRLDHIFKGVENIKEAQIFQEYIDKIILKIVPENEFNKKNQEQFINALKIRLGEEIEYVVEILDEIPRGKNGKFRGVVSKVKKQ